MLAGRPERRRDQRPRRLPLAQLYPDGVRLTGIDFVPAMLDVARRRAVEQVAPCDHTSGAITRPWCALLRTRGHRVIDGACDLIDLCVQGPGGVQRQDPANGVLVELLEATGLLLGDLRGGI